METRGKNPRQSVFAIIPARYSSVRLPGKMLLPIAGRPLILHTVEKARGAETVDEVIVATDDHRIFDVVSAEGHRAVMTSPVHPSGSDRIAEVAAALPEGTIVVNVQGDEPVISPATIDRAVSAIRSDADANIVSAFEPFDSLQQVMDGNNVKVVVSDDGYALYFSRLPIPSTREATLRHGGDLHEAIKAEPEILSNFKKHTGLYVYRREYLLKFTELPRTTLEQLEMLEQLRALENGARIRMVEAAARSIGIDTVEDLEIVRGMIEVEARANKIVA